MEYVIVAVFTIACINIADNLSNSPLINLFLYACIFVVFAGVVVGLMTVHAQHYHDDDINK